MIGLKRFRNWTLSRPVDEALVTETCIKDIHDRLGPLFSCGRKIRLSTGTHELFIFLRFEEKVSDTVVRIGLPDEYTLKGAHTYKDSVTMAMQESGTVDGPYYNGDYSFSPELVSKFITLRGSASSSSRIAVINSDLLTLGEVELVDRGYISLLDLPRLVEAKTIYLTSLLNTKIS